MKNFKRLWNMLRSSRASAGNRCFGKKFSSWLYNNPSNDGFQRKKHFLMNFVIMHNHVASSFVEFVGGIE